MKHLFLKKRRRKRNFRQRNKKVYLGFSLLEVVISMFVLSVGMLGVMQLMTATLRHSFNQRDAIIASQLAQEGIELVYNIRDTNIAAGNSAFENIESGTNKRIDATSPTPTLSGSTDFSLYKDSSHAYTHSSSSGNMQTKFSRKIMVEEIVSSLGLSSRKVTSYVIWGSESFPSNGNNPEESCLIMNHCAFAQVILQAY